MVPLVGIVKSFLLFFAIYVAVECRSLSGDGENLRVERVPGSPWPMPTSYTSTGDMQSLNQAKFHFSATGNICDTLESAFERYYYIIFRRRGAEEGNSKTNDRLLFRAWQRQNAAVLDTLKVNVMSPCDRYPTLESDESYNLSITTGYAQLTSTSIWGALRGLETFSQLIHHTDDGSLGINNTQIMDKPRFAWRGILLDTSRHYLPVDVILLNLEAMAYNKINVFHWHIVDDQSFPYQSRDFPNLSLKGAYSPYTHVYTQEHVREIIEFARARGIRVVPEFDSPGHSQSWGLGEANLLTQCYSAGKPTGGYGPIDPTLKSAYNFLDPFVKELTEVFKDKYIHLGGDEVDFSCWKSNPNITAFMQAKGFGTDYTKLEEYYVQQLLTIVKKYQASYIVWQEVFDNGVKVDPDTVIEVWKGNYQAELAAVTKTGLKAIISSPWYLDYISYGADWRNYYAVEPLNFNGTAAQKALVIGGEACLWAEYVDASNVVSRLWPRASAIAERLWSPETVSDVNAAVGRMEEHRCRMIRRGVYGQVANGPGYCPEEANIWG